MSYIIIVLLIFLGGGISYVSDSALPGSPLYPIKIDVNENLRMRLSMSVQAKAQTDASLAERRLEEAEKLGMETGLNADRRALIEKNFQLHADGVAAGARTFASQDVDTAADIVSGFEASLEAHDLVLGQLMAKTTNAQNRDEEEKMRTHIETEHKTISDLREQLEARLVGETGPDVQTAAQGRMQAAESAIAEAKKFIESQKAKLGVTVVADAKAQLAVAEKTFAEGSPKFDAGDYSQAFTIFSSAHRITQQVKSLVESDLRLQTDIHASAGNAANEVRADQAGLEARMSGGAGSGTATTPGAK